MELKPWLFLAVHLILQIVIKDIIRKNVLRIDSLFTNKEIYSICSEKNPFYHK